MDDTKLLSQNFAGRELSFESNKYAPYANVSVKIQYGDTVVLATVTSAEPLEGTDFFPLRVDYEEKLYAGGLIKGSRFIKREGRPTDEAILGSRLIDRAIRPYFPKDYMDQVQVIATVLSVDDENDPQLVALWGVLTALHISDIPWQGPMGAVQVGLIDNNLVINPTATQKVNATLNLLVCASSERVVMLEAEGHEVADEQVAEAIIFGHTKVQELLAIIDQYRQQVGQEKYDYQSTAIAEELLLELRKSYGGEIKQALEQDFDNQNLIKNIVAKALISYQEVYSENVISCAINKIKKEFIRENILVNEHRVDGRKLDQIRELSIEIGLLPRTHGSALFQRGYTQVLTIATLGSASSGQLLEGMHGTSTKNYLHHYNAPPFSSGEVGVMRGPGRREIGHGALAEKALAPVLPKEEEFPYTIRLVSEVLAQNGSSSMASTCGSSLALMDAGVPISKHVAGISIGLVEGDNANYKLLTDIRGVEDFNGDMDYKVAGTKDGVTAIQLDVKNSGLTPEMVKEVMQKAKSGRLYILEQMAKVIAEPKKDISKYAPMVFTLKIDPEKIGAVIGSGGKVIKGLIEKTGADISVEDDGSIFVASEDRAAAEKALNLIKGIVAEPEVGKVYPGRVMRIMDFGAFVEFLPGKEGLVHISELSHEHVNKVTDVVKVGDELEVKIIEIDNLGRVNLSLKALQTKPSKPDASKKDNFRKQKPAATNGWSPRH